MKIRPSAWVLILANLVPLLGVLLYDWSVLNILVLYWAENVVIGLVNVLRMLSCRPDAAVTGPLRAAGPASRVFLVAFFIVHYGGFCFGHLAVLLSFFSTGRGSLTEELSALDLSDVWFWIAIGAIFLSHLFSFFTNFIANGEYRKTRPAALMGRPYGRIVVMHLTIIVGALLVQTFGNVIGLLVALVVVKIVVDLRMHEKERRTYAEVLAQAG